MGMGFGPTTVTHAEQTLHELQLPARRRDAKQRARTTRVDHEHASVRQTFHLLPPSHLHINRLTHSRHHRVLPTVRLLVERLHTIPPHDQTISLDQRRNEAREILQQYATARGSQQLVSNDCHQQLSASVVSISCHQLLS